LTRAFSHFGGVPRRVRYDNLKSAVETVLKGRGRIESERFMALRSHYGYDSFFCQPGIKGAHEKGGVEGEIGRFHRRYMVPVPKVASISELNEVLLAAVQIDDLRHIAGRKASVAEHFALEVDHLRPLPAEPFDYKAVGNFRVDRKARVNVRGAWYSVPARYAGRRLGVRIGADTIEVLEGAKVVAAHPRSLKGQENLVLDHYLEVLKIKPGALPGATALARARASGAFSEAHQGFWDEARRQLRDRNGTKALIDVLLLHRNLRAGAVIAGIQGALAVGKVDPAVVSIEARRVAEGAPAQVALGQDLERYNRATPDISGYDQLLEGSA
jgi:5-methylcytosine-specific restriction endonuclease McrA